MQTAGLAHKADEHSVDLALFHVLDRTPTWEASASETRPHCVEALAQETLQHLGVGAAAAQLCLGV